MPMNLADYHPDWRWISRQIREQANQRCEFCDVANHAVGARDIYGAWHDEEDIHGMNSTEGARLFAGEFPRMIRVVLTVAHLDQDRGNNDPSNLRALCQKCHNAWDRPYRLRHMIETVRCKRLSAVAARGQLEMALGDIAT